MERDSTTETQANIDSAREHDQARLMAVWRQEQYQVASQVVVLQDDDDEDLHDDNENNSFRCMSLATSDDSSSCSLFGGVDVSFDNNIAVAVYVVLDERPDNTMEIVYRDYEYYHNNDIPPYVSSYLAFREVTPLVRLIQRQQKEFPQYTPKTILVDGNGIFHIRRAGLACFVGVQCCISTIGVGKSLYSCEENAHLTREMVSRYLDEITMLKLEQELDAGQIFQADDDQDRQVLLLSRPCLDPNQVNDQEKRHHIDRRSVLKRVAPFCRGIGVMMLRQDTNNNEILACALLGHGGGGCLKNNTVGSTNPIYVSVGHNMSLHNAVRIVARLSLFRIPEPIRQADLIGRELLRQRKQNR